MNSVAERAEAILDRIAERRVNCGQPEPELDTVSTPPEHAADASLR